MTIRVQYRYTTFGILNPRPEVLLAPYSINGAKGTVIITTSPGATEDHLLVAPLLLGRRGVHHLSEKGTGRRGSAVKGTGRGGSGVNKRVAAAPCLRAARLIPGRGGWRFAPCRCLCSVQYHVTVFTLTVSVSVSVFTLSVSVSVSVCPSQKPAQQIGSVGKHMHQSCSHHSQPASKQAR